MFCARGTGNRSGTSIAKQRMDGITGKFFFIGKIREAHDGETAGDHGAHFLKQLAGRKKCASGGDQVIAQQDAVTRPKIFFLDTDDIGTVLKLVGFDGRSRTISPVFEPESTEAASGRRAEHLAQILWHRYLQSDPPACPCNSRTSSRYIRRTHGDQP